MGKNVISFPTEQPLKWIVGPFKSNRVVIEDRLIPKLEALRKDTLTSFLLDERFILEVPNDIAYQVAHFVATAMAVGAGYSHIGADTKTAPFASPISELQK